MKRQARALSPDELRALADHLDALLAAAQAREAEPEDEEPGQARPRVSYRRKWVKCGNPDCKCARGEKHGPYWYASWREGDRVRSKYLGKELPR